MPGDLAQDNGHSDSWPLRILRILTQLHFHHHTNSFADRFKHDVISSSLLSSTPFATPLSHHHRSESPLPALPGTLHSRDPSATTQDVHPLSHQSNKRPPTESYNYGLASIAFVLAVVIFAAGYYTLTALLLGGTFYLIQFHHNPTVENQTLNISPVSSYFIPSQQENEFTYFCRWGKEYGSFKRPHFRREYVGFYSPRSHHPTGIRRTFHILWTKYTPLPIFLPPSYTPIITPYNSNPMRSHSRIILGPYSP